MPTYEYECCECGHGFEIFQSMMDRKLRKCPQCGKLKLARLIGAGSGVIFRGSGFYETDYKRKTNVPPCQTGGSKDTKTAEPSKCCQANAKSCPAAAAT